MSAATLAERIKRGAVTGTGAGFVTLQPGLLAAKVALKNDPLRGKTGVCNSETPVTLFSREVESKRTANGTGQAANDPAATAPASGQINQDEQTMDWRAADAAYLRHHWRCASCCAAGHGRGQRCATGAQLWNEYKAAWSAAQTNGRKRT